MVTYAKESTDHRGNIYPSLKDMCDAYDVDTGTYYNRLERGWTVERALETKARDHTDDRTDHRGVVYESVAAMCNAWKVNISTYYSRRNRGWTKEEALEKPRKRTPHNTKPSTDHLGKNWPSKKAMCEAHGTTVEAYNYAICKGLSVEEALTGKHTHWEECRDHLGNIYPTKSAMCRAYGLDTNLFCGRIKLGWSLKDALTMGVKKRRH